MVAQRAEVVIVGGGPAGLTTAIALLRAAPDLGGRVVVLEKSTYPREKICAGAVGGRGDAILRGLGACPDVPSVLVAGMSFRGVEGEQTARVEGPIGRVVRRIEWDHALARIAGSAGATIVEGARAERVERATHAAGGATVMTARGDYSARVVVGADGVGSAVRKAMGLGHGALRAQALEVDTEPTASDRARDLVHFDASDRALSGYFWDFPTLVAGRELVCRGVYHLRTQACASADLEGLLAERLRRLGVRVDRARNKRFAERGLAADEPITSGPLLLVGEAAGIDPVTGEGIAQAIEYGALAGRFIAAALSRERRLSDWATVVRRSRLGIDLRLRRRVARAFFGSSRRALEDVLVARPAAVRAGCRHFAGMTQDPRDLVDVGGAVLGIALRKWLGDAWGQVLGLS